MKKTNWCKKWKNAKYQRDQNLEFLFFQLWKYFYHSDLPDIHWDDCSMIAYHQKKKKWMKRLNNLVLNSMTSSLKVCCLQCSLSPTCRSLNEKLKKRKYHYFTTFFPPFVWTALLLFHTNLHTHRLCLATKQKPKLKYSFLWAETDVHLMFEI